MSIKMQTHLQKQTKSHICKFFNEQNKKIGYISLFIDTDKQDRQFLQINKIEVYPKYRKNGLASDMLSEVFSYFNNLYNTKYMKPKAVYASAQGFWEKMYTRQLFPIERCYDIIDGF